MFRPVKVYDFVSKMVGQKPVFKQTPADGALIFVLFILWLDLWDKYMYIDIVEIWTKK